MSKEVISKSTYVMHLAKEQQEELSARVQFTLDKLDLYKDEYTDALENAMGGRLQDLEELISLEGFKTFEVK